MTDRFEDQIKLLAKAYKSCMGNIAEALTVAYESELFANEKEFHRVMFWLFQLDDIRRVYETDETHDGCCVHEDRIRKALGIVPMCPLGEHDAKAVNKVAGVQLYVCRKCHSHKSELDDEWTQYRPALEP